MRINQLVELEENYRKAFDHLIGNQEKTKGVFDKRARQRMLGKGDLVLMWIKERKNQECTGNLKACGWVLSRLKTKQEQILSISII
jgi:hypothetical protein